MRYPLDRLWTAKTVAKKIFWTLKLILLLIIALPIALVQSMVSVDERSYWSRTLRRSLFTIRQNLLEPFWLIFKKSKRGSDIEDLITDFDLNTMYLRFLRNYLVLFILVLLVWGSLASWVVLQITKPAGSRVITLPTASTPMVVVKNNLDSFIDFYEFKENIIPPKEFNSVLVLDRGRLAYSAHSFPFSRQAPWQRISDLLYVSSVEVTDHGSQGKVINFQDSRGFSYQVPVLKSLVFWEEQKNVYVVDGQGNIWMAEISKLEK